MKIRAKRIKNRRHRASRLAASLALVTTALLTGAAAQASPAGAAGPGWGPQAGGPCKFTPFGGIGEYWQQMGGQGFLGCPRNEIEENLGSARVRRFDQGTIAWFPFPDHRPFLLSLKQGPGEPLRVDWWDDYNQGGYQLRIDLAPGQIPADGDPQWPIQGRFEDGTTATANLRSGVAYDVRIRGCDEDIVECYGFLGPVRIVGA